MNISLSRDSLLAKSVLGSKPSLKLLGCPSHCHSHPYLCPSLVLEDLVLALQESFIKAVETHEYFSFQ